jgi:predicted nicotinamide N-methyase
MIFDTEKVSLTYGIYDIQLLTIKNIDALFDALILKGTDHDDVKDERIPYWAELWPSAIAMSRYIIDNQIVMPDMTVTELGCGLALPAIVAGKMGAHIIATDYLNEALLFANQNWDLNNIKQNVLFKKMDWRMPDIACKADLLLASDVAYEERAFAPLLDTFKKLLNPNGKIIITEPNRPISKFFFSNLHTEGYQVKHTDMMVERKGFNFLINIYELTPLE